MSNRLVKLGNQIEVPNDEVLGVIQIFKSGKVQVEAPTLHPAVLIKYLQSTIVDLQYASFQPAEIKKVETV